MATEGKKSFLTKILEFFMVDAAVTTVKDGVRGAVKEKVEKSTKSNDEVRAEMFSFLVGALKKKDPEAEIGLRLAQAERQLQRPRPYGNHENYSPSSENRMVKVLTNLYRYLSEKKEEELRMIVFQDLGHDAMNDRERFDASIEMLVDDKFAQYVQEIILKIKEAGPEVLKAVDNTAKKAANGINWVTELIKKA